MCCRFGSMIDWHLQCILALTMFFAGCGATESPPSHQTSSPKDKIEQPRPQHNSPPIEPAQTTRAPEILDWYKVDGLPKKVALFNHVFWEPADTVSLRQLLRDSELVRDRSVLEIGTGTGIVALCCAQAGADSVVATDINPWAIRNCQLNAEELSFGDTVQPRLVSQKTPDAWSVIGPNERFDVIVSNPPWELGKPTRVEDFAFYDPDFQLMKSFIDGLRSHLRPKGRAFLAYGCVTAIRRLKTLITEQGMTFTVRDDRDLDQLPENFLPGMLIEIHAAR